MARSKRPTISDLAEKTGLSRSTISKVFSGSNDVLPQTRQWVLRTAEEIGYPFRSRRPKNREKTGRYGLILPNLDNPHYSELVHALDAEARRSGKIILLGLHYGDAKVADSIIRHWYSGLTDGVIVDPPDLSSVPHVIDLLRSRTLPVVFLHGRPAADCFLVHHARGSSYKRALRQLLDLGHTRIAYVGIDAPTARLAESFKLYGEALQTANLEVREDYLHFGPNDADTGFEALRRFLVCKPRPTGVICFNDILACGFCHGMRVNRLRCPEDFSVVGGDNIREAARLGLTTVHSDRMRMAREVYRLLQILESEPNRPAEDVNIPTELIVRESVSFAPKAAG